LSAVRESDERVERGCVMGGRSAGRWSLLGFGPLRWVGFDLRYDGGVEGRNRDIYGWRLGYGVEGGGRGCG
jgi:hypothetical protein